MRTFRFRCQEKIRVQRALLRSRSGEAHVSYAAILMKLGPAFLRLLSTEKLVKTEKHRFCRVTLSLSLVFFCLTVACYFRRSLDPSGPQPPHPPPPPPRAVKQQGPGGVCERGRGAGNGGHYLLSALLWAITLFYSLLALSQKARKGGRPLSMDRLSGAPAAAPAWSSQPAAPPAEVFFGKTELFLMSKGKMEAVRLSSCLGVEGLRRVPAS